ncbi:peptidoglycan-binding protein [Streptomyces sp. Ag109_G2-15]|uniref:peptidoglycan-binding domain-containing protein n=1 Tax=Streptomyces sp. Ag109_G2-15 TaxID=1938850 RepID=UPI0027BA20CA|nr:peptidoglycan-binding domain-containing protein [Streptomyces sp. Ag109_G2-15]
MTAVSVLGLIGNAPSAGAADGWCSTTTSVWEDSGRFIQPATSSGSTSCIMGRGSSGSAVAELQRALVNCHELDTGGIDGVYGAQTESAVRSIQTRIGLKPDGIYGPDTRLHVFWQYYWNDGDVTCSFL